MWARFRVTLPVSLGAVSVALIIWDLYNLHIIRSMGWAWTDSKGRYSASWLEPGKYLVSIHYFNSPTTGQSRYASKVEVYDPWPAVQDLAAKVIFGWVPRPHFYMV